MDDKKAPAEREEKAEVDATTENVPHDERESCEGRHKYLNAIGVKSTNSCVFCSTDVDDERMPRFARERREHSFDSRETWSLDYTLATWLYEHLMFYKEIADETTDLSFHQFDVPTIMVSEEGGFQTETRHVTEGEAIDLACEYLRKAVATDWADDSDTYWEQAALRIVTEILPTLWW